MVCELYIDPNLEMWLPFDIFGNCKLIRVCSLVGRYFYNVYIAKPMKIVFSLIYKYHGQ